MVFTKLNSSALNALTLPQLFAYEEACEKWVQEKKKEYNDLINHLMKISKVVRNKHVPEIPISLNNVKDRKGEIFRKVFMYPEKFRCHYRDNSSNLPKTTHCGLTCSSAKKTMVALNGETDLFCFTHQAAIKKEIEKGADIIHLLMLMEDAPAATATVAPLPSSTFPLALQQPLTSFPLTPNFQPSLLNGLNFNLGVEELDNTSHPNGAQGLLDSFNWNLFTTVNDPETTLGNSMDIDLHIPPPPPTARPKRTKKTVKKKKDAMVHVPSSSSSSPKSNYVKPSF